MVDKETNRELFTKGAKAWAYRNISRHLYSAVTSATAGRQKQLKELWKIGGEARQGSNSEALSFTRKEMDTRCDVDEP